MFFSADAKSSSMLITAWGAAFCSVEAVVPGWAVLLPQETINVSVRADARTHKDLFKVIMTVSFCFL